MQGFPILSFLTWLPIAGGLLVLAFGERGIRAGRWVALGIAVATFVASIPLYCYFDVSSFALPVRRNICRGSRRFTPRIRWASTASRCR